MSRLPVSIHQLTFNYKDCKITIVNEFGNSNVATVCCDFTHGLRLPDFQVRTKSQLWKFFNRSASILKIDCAQASFKTRLEKNLSGFGLEEAACEHLFQPEIDGFYENKNYTIQSRYSLQFPNKEKASA